MGHAQDIRNKAIDGHLGWRTKVVSRYASAYNQAYEEYQKVLKEQAEADKARAELAISAVSLIGGSILMATIAQTSLRVIAGNAMLNFVCKRNLERTFNAMAVLESNKPFMFALGKLLDIVKDRTNTEIKDRVTKEFDTGPKVNTSNPLDIFIKLSDALDVQHLATNRAVEMVERSTMTASLKERSYAELARAPLCTPPTDTINEVKLAKKIELSFYLKAVLDSDRLVIFGPAYPGATRRDMRDVPIAQAPSAPDYPRATNNPPAEAGQVIVAPELGDKVEARLKTLHHEIFGRNFRADRPWFQNPFNPGPSPGDMGRRELRDAENRLDDLASLVRPMQLLQVRS